MNLVERWFSELTTKWIRHGTHRSVTELKDSIQHWNENPKPSVWHKAADQILDTLAAYIQRIPDSGHCERGSESASCNGSSCRWSGLGSDVSESMEA